MGLPPVVVGLVVYLLLSRSGHLACSGCCSRPAAMIIAQAVLVTPIVAALARQIVEDLWEEYANSCARSAARPLGAIGTLLWDGRFTLITALLAGFGRASAEVGAVMIVGGNIDHVDAGDDDHDRAGDQQGQSAPGARPRHHADHAVAGRQRRRPSSSREPRGGACRDAGPALPSCRSGSKTSLRRGRPQHRMPISLELARGPRTIILGPNGAGKSLLLRLCHGLIQPTARPDRSGAAPMRRKPRHRQAMVFQRPVMLRRSALANVDYALKLRGLAAASGRDRSPRCCGCTGLSALARPAGPRAVGRRAAAPGPGARLGAASPRCCFSTNRPPASIPPSSRRSKSIITRDPCAGTKIVMTTHDLGPGAPAGRRDPVPRSWPPARGRPGRRPSSRPATPRPPPSSKGDLTWDEPGRLVLSQPAAPCGLPGRPGPQRRGPLHHRRVDDLDPGFRACSTTCCRSSPRRPASTCGWSPRAPARRSRSAQRGDADVLFVHDQKPARRNSSPTAMA